MNRTFELATKILDVVTAGYLADPDQKPHLPERRFVYAGSVAYDKDDMMWVTWTGEAGMTGNVATTTGSQRVQVFAVRAATYQVGILRCAPTIQQSAMTFTLPKPKALEATAERVTDDVTIVRNALIRAHVNDEAFGPGCVLALGRIDAIPSSDVTGFVQEVTVSLA